MQHKVERASLYSLGEEDLTHYGQSLAEMDDFDHLDVLSGSDEEDGEGEHWASVGHIGRQTMGHLRTGEHCIPNTWTVEPCRLCTHNVAL